MALGRGAGVSTTTAKALRSIGVSATVRRHGSKTLAPGSDRHDEHIAFIRKLIAGFSTVCSNATATATSATASRWASISSTWSMRGAGRIPGRTGIKPRPRGMKKTSPQRRRSKGHGRIGAQAYPGATHITIRHPSLTSGDTCPECHQRKVYAATTPGYRVRLVGRRLSARASTTLSRPSTLLRTPVRHPTASAFGT